MFSRIFSFRVSPLVFPTFLARTFPPRSTIGSVRVEGWIEIDQVYRFVFDITPKHIQVVTVVEDVSHKSNKSFGYLYIANGTKIIAGPFTLSVIA